MGRRPMFGQSEATFRCHQPYQRSSCAMAGARSYIAWLGLALAAGCNGASRPPPELSGLWSAGQAACEAGVGIRFRADAIEAVYRDETETLFEHPRYRVESSGEVFRVRILYELPRITGGVRSAGAHGVVVLTRQEDGRLVPEAHNLVDPRTGAVRLRIDDDPGAQALTLEPCGAHPWRGDLRGRTNA